MPPDPLILAFDTSAAHCAAALLSGDRVLVQRREIMAKGQAERLIPLLQEVLAEAGKALTDLSAIAVGTGPGNFTGIRISVSAARGLALSLGIPAIGVSTFEAMAQGLARPVLVCLDARRGQSYLGLMDTDQTLKSTLVEGTEIPTGFSPGQALFLCDETSCVTAPPAAKSAEPIYSLAEGIARTARAKLGQNIPKPAPLYIRLADAAPSSEPMPVMLP